MLRILLDQLTYLKGYSLKIRAILRRPTME